ncbi:MAG: hypothetical protein KAH32_07295 [Chlamydiia bacterium]|nr:hypothetical protein [Chlamydiia bacterium]
MKKFIYIIAAASMMFTGCVKDEIYTPPKTEVIVVSKIEYSETPDLSDIKVKVEYESEKEITEARVYYRIDGEAYTKVNKVKGEDDPSFTQSDVTIDLTGISNVSNGSKISFYVRLTYKDLTEEYFVGKNTNISKIAEEVAKGKDVAPLNQMEVGGTAVEEDQPQEITITDYNGFSGLTVIRKVAGDLEFDVMFETTNPEFKGVKLYYTLNEEHSDAEWTVFVDAETEEDGGRVTLEIDVKADDNKYSYTIPAADVKVGDVVRLYFRGYTKDAAGDKDKKYYAPSLNDTFDHDVYSQWSKFTVK